MPAPTPLAIVTSSVQRLLKEEATYRTELESQERRLRNLQAETEDEDGNRGFLIGQEVSVISICVSVCVCSVVLFGVVFSEGGFVGDCAGGEGKEELW